MLRANYIEQMGTGIKKMKNLVKKEELPPIKFKFTNFTTLTFYRPPYPGSDLLEPSKSDMDFSKNLSKILNIRGEKINTLSHILTHIENGIFSNTEFAKKRGITLRSVYRHIQLLKEAGLIYLEGSRKTGKYEITKKYKKLKNLSK